MEGCLSIDNPIQINEVNWVSINHNHVIPIIKYRF